jgi:hypothetical protein
MLRLGMALTMASCTSLKLDDSAPFATLRGGPPSMNGRQRVAIKANENLQFTRGLDGTQWLALSTNSDFGPAYPPRLIRLGDPATEEELPADQTVLFGSSAFFLDRSDLDETGKVTTWHITVRHPGDDGIGLTFDFDGEAGPFDLSDNDAAIYVYPPFDPGTDPMAPVVGHLLRTDGSYQRELTLKNRFSVMLATFDPSGQFLVTLDDNGNVITHSTTEASDTIIGHWSQDIEPGALGSSWPTLWLGVNRPEVVICDHDGLRGLSFQPAPPRVIDPSRCSAEFRFFRRDHFLYDGPSGLESAAADGSTPPKTLPFPMGAGTLSIDPDRVAWSRHSPGPPDRPNYAPLEISDGWVDDRQFMTRGRLADFSLDGKHLYFLEHAADGSEGIGELRSYEVASGTTHVLSLNVRQWVELDDGRLMAVSNAYKPGDWNRVILIDELRRTIDWVAAGTDGFTLIHGTQEVLVRLVDDNDDKTWVRMPIPPVQP